jgi:dTDP-4-amino-4,6-dideoxygalactose transaminase
MNKRITIPLAKPFFSGREVNEIAEVLKSGWVMQGPKVKEFEGRVADYVGARYAVAASSGTTALHLALLALDIQKGDEVIVPSYSFIASANSIVYAGACLVFIDIDPDTFNLDPAEIKRKISKKTKAIMVVHQFGLPADMDRITSIADKYGLKIIEDAACALGSAYKNKKVGTLSRLTCFSFHPRKVITTGEGGMITTAHKKIADKIRILRSHGLKGNKGIMLGYNYRMTDLQAAVGIEQLKKIDEILTRRHKLAERYNEAFKENRYIKVPFVPEYVTFFNYQSYVIKIKRNSSKTVQQAINLLKIRGIVVKPGAMPTHRQPYYQRHFGKVKLPKTEEIFNSSLALPLYPSMSQREQDYVIKNFYLLFK